MRIVYTISLFILTALASSAQYPPYHVSIRTAGSTGYYFIEPIEIGNSTNTQMILDSAGNVIYCKQFPNGNPIDFKLNPGAMMSYGVNGNLFYMMDSTFTIFDSVSCRNSIQTDTHDIDFLPNGHFLLLGYEWVIMDLSHFPLFYHSTTVGSAAANVKCVVVQELDAAKNVVFEWHGKDHFSFDDVDPFFLDDTATVDWTHSNAVTMDADGNILLSTRHFDEITKINRSDSSIMWRFGGRRNEFTFVGDTVPFYGQHNIRRIANGHVTLYDNGHHLFSHGARALEYALDEINMTAEVKWSYIYDSSMYSIATGNVQRLANSNTVVNYGFIGSNNVHFNVVDSTGSKVFELAFDDTIVGYRSYNFPTLPWSFNRPVITCRDSAGLHLLDAGAGYHRYLWNTGATTESIVVTDTNTFMVFVGDGNGGLISSNKLIVSDTSQPCLLNAVPEFAQKETRLFPNPATREITITNVSSLDFPKRVLVYDINGRVVVDEIAEPDDSGRSLSLNLDGLLPGIYVVWFGNRSLRFVKV